MRQSVMRHGSLESRFQSLHTRLIRLNVCDPKEKNPKIESNSSGGRELMCVDFDCDSTWSPSSWTLDSMWVERPESGSSCCPTREITEVTTFMWEWVCERVRVRSSQNAIIISGNENWMKNVRSLPVDCLWSSSLRCLRERVSWSPEPGMRGIRVQSI